MAVNEKGVEKRVLEYLAVFLGPFLGAIIQALAGFGFAIVFMIFVPHFLGLVDAGSLSAMISFPQNILMYLTYRKHVRYKKVLVAAIPYIIVSTSLIRILPDMDVSLLRSIFGIF